MVGVENLVQDCLAWWSDPERTARGDVDLPTGITDDHLDYTIRCRDTGAVMGIEAQADSLPGDDS